jgi:hypothetical protein
MTQFVVTKLIAANCVRGGFDFHLEPLIKAVGLKRVVEAAGVERVVEAAGVERVIQAVGLQRLIRDKGVEWLLARMSPQQRRELKEHLTRLRLRPTRFRKRAPVVPRSGYAGSIPS